jgi:hypothetical protein
MNIGILFIIGYSVIALSCVGLGYYLSFPGNTWSTLFGDAFNVLLRRSRPTPVEPSTPVEPVTSTEPKKPSFFEELHSETWHDLVVPAPTPVSNEGHEEAVPEVVHDEP